MSVKAREKKWFNVASTGEGKRKINTCGLANIERILREEI
jgi:hypothetical protein